MAIHRLRGDNLESFQLYPAFERRVISFARRSDIPINPNSVAAELRHRFINMPIACGYWLAMEKDQVMGHLCGWLTINMGVLEIFFWQQEGTFTAEQREGWAVDCIRWIEEIEAARGRVSYIPPGGPVSGCSFVTDRDAEVYGRYIERIGFERPRTVTMVKFRRKPSAPSVSVPSLSIPKGLMN